MVYNQGKVPCDKLDFRFSPHGLFVSDAPVESSFDFFGIAVVIRDPTKPCLCLEEHEEIDKILFWGWKLAIWKHFQLLGKKWLPHGILWARMTQPSHNPPTVMERTFSNYLMVVHDGTVVWPSDVICVVRTRSPRPCHSSYMNKHTTVQKVLDLCSSYGCSLFFDSLFLLNPL